MKVIVINGPMGSGKTSVGRYIADSCSGTAFIDGDWCMDLHPFAGSDATRKMAVDNILHMVRNYKECTECKMIVIVWLMDKKEVRDEIFEGLSGMGFQITRVTLICDEDTLIRRWRNDTSCEWRTDEWLDVSLRSLPVFTRLEDTLDTTGLTVEEAASKIMLL